MSNLSVAAAQLGPIGRETSREQVVKRLLEQMHQAKQMGAELLVFPELALTTFFPRWWMEEAEFIEFFEREMPSKATQPLFETATKLGLAFYLGYAELAEIEGQRHYFNTAILVSKEGKIVGKYRKVHVPGHSNNMPWRPFQHLEKKYFEPGHQFDVCVYENTQIGMAICADRRWPETYRTLALKGAELMLVGYNTPVFQPMRHPDETLEVDQLSMFHHHLIMQAGAYQNALWLVAAGKTGIEEGCELLGGSCIIAPNGQIVAQCTSKADEVIVANCDLTLCKRNRALGYNYTLNSHPEAYLTLND